MDAAPPFSAVFFLVLETRDPSPGREKLSFRPGENTWRRGVITQNIGYVVGV
jgi:hypothetical protein